ncbi:MAG: YihY/virulence factor BrkB family protein, partial [Aggregatilineales bacterium]
GILQGLRSQLLSFGMVLVTGFLLLVSLVLSTALSALSQFVGARMPIPAGVWELVNLAASFLVIMLLFAAIYKVLPDTKIAWRDVWVGSAVTALLFTVGKWLIGLYLGHASPASAYGAAGALVVVLLWIYYSAHILFLGAEFTQVYARKHGSLSTAPQSAHSTTQAATASRKLPAATAPGNKPSAAAISRKTAVESQKTERKRDVTGTIERIVRISSPLLLVIARIVIMVDQARASNKQRQKPHASAKQ